MRKLQSFEYRYLDTSRFERKEMLSIVVSYVECVRV